MIVDSLATHAGSEDRNVLPADAVGGSSNPVHSGPASGPTGQGGEGAGAAEEDGRHQQSRGGRGGRGGGNERCGERGGGRGRSAADGEWKSGHREPSL